MWLLYPLVMPKKVNLSTQVPFSPVTVFVTSEVINHCFLLLLESNYFKVAHTWENNSTTLSSSVIKGELFVKGILFERSLLHVYCPLSGQYCCIVSAFSLRPSREQPLSILSGHSSIKVTSLCLVEAYTPHAKSFKCKHKWLRLPLSVC